MSNHFRKELLPPARTFYERELGKLSRPSRGWSLGNCPFHESKSKKSFSVNLEGGGFHCFGCGAKGGDIVAFVRQRDLLSFKEAAQRLGAWDEAPSPEAVRKMEAQVRESDRQKAEEQARKEADRRHRLQLRDDVHTAARLQREASERLSELRQGAIPISELIEEEVCWDVMVLARDDLRECEREYCAAAGLEYE